MDIFNPEICRSHFAACATQEQINVFLYQQLSILKQNYVDSLNKQLSLNNQYGLKLDNHESRITILENAIIRIDSTLDLIKTEQQNIRIDYNSFKSSVNATLNLYQQNIDELVNLTTSIVADNQSIHKELNDIKAKINIDLLNQIITTYQDIFNKIDSTIDAKLTPFMTKVNGDIESIKNSFEDYKIELNSSLLLYKSEVSNQLSEFNSILTQYNTRLTTLETSLTKQVGDLVEYVHDNIHVLFDHINEINTNAERIEKESKERDKYNFDTLTAKISTLDFDLRKLIQETSDNAAKDNRDLEQRIVSSINDISNNVSILETHMTALNDSDKRQWDTINQILTLANKAIEEHGLLENKVDGFIINISKQILDLSDRIKEFEVNIRAVSDISDYNFGNAFRAAFKLNKYSSPRTYAMDKVTAIFTFTKNASDVLLTCSLNVKISEDCVAFYDARGGSSTMQAVANNSITVDLQALSFTPKTPYCMKFYIYSKTDYWSYPLEANLLVLGDTGEIQWLIQNNPVNDKHKVFGSPVIS